MKLTYYCRRCGNAFKKRLKQSKYCSPACVNAVKKEKQQQKTEASIVATRRRSKERLLEHAEENEVHADTMKKILGSQIEEHGYNFCWECGDSGCMLHGHHIVYKSEAPGHPALHDELNVLILCDTCHNRAHKNKKTFQAKRVLERGLHDLFPEVLKDKYL